jgi:hypothetical protein
MKKENQLLARLAKAVGITKMDEPVEAVAEVAEQVVEAPVEAVTEVLGTELLVYSEELQAEMANLKAQAEAATSALAEMTAKLEAAHADLSKLVAEKAEMAATAAAVKLAARKEKVIAAIGTERADALMAATEGLDDAQFAAVVSAMSVATDAEAKSPLFSEVGVTAEADAAKVVEESAEARILKQKYGVK